MFQQVFKFLADLRFAIIVLLAISFFSIIGTIIEQEQSIEIYKLNYPISSQLFGFFSWENILFFGFDHVYKTWWFLSLIVIFSISLITCTLIQQVPSVKIARRCQFFRDSKNFKKLSRSTLLNYLYFGKVINQLKKRQYSVFCQKNILYCYKGLIGCIAPIIVHFSMILILLGTLISSLSGFKAQENIPNTEIFRIQNILSTGQVSTITNSCGRINDFWISYTTKEKKITQFYSDISILDFNGNEIKHKTNYINSPIIYKSVYFYQTDWNLIGIRIKQFASNIVEYPLTLIAQSKNKYWLTWFNQNNLLNSGIVAITDNLQGYCSFYDYNGFFLGNVELNETISNKNQLLDIISSSGFLVKKDPGIPSIYFGFFCLIVSTICSYTTYSQIWILQKRNQIFITGNTTRATIEFEFELTNIIKQLTKNKM